MANESIDDLNFEDEPLGDSDFSPADSGGDDRYGDYIADTDDDTEGNSDYNNTNDDNASAVDYFLQTKGIDDPSRIKFANDDGSISEVDWNNLSTDEQFNILNQGNETITDADRLDDDELDLINRIRLSNMSVADYLTLEQQKGINNFVNSQQPQEPNFIVDDYTDDDLFMLDLQTKSDDLSDEELVQALEAAKANPTVFEKQVQGLRNEYRRLEEERNERNQAIAQQEQNERYQVFSSNIANSINNLTNLGELDIALEPEDADELYEFITGTDAAGVNHFYKALNDPDTLTRAAWFALHGEDVIQSISNYYSNAIAQANRNGYERGLYDAQNGTNQPQVVINPRRSSRRKNNNISSIDDLTY